MRVSPCQKPKLDSGLTKVADWLDSLTCATAHTVSFEFSVSFFDSYFCFSTVYVK